VAHATDTTSTETTRRDFLILATGAAGVVSLGAIVVPLVSQLAPDAQTIAAGAPMDVDLAPIAEGQAIKLFWRGKLIFVRHRTKKEIDEALAVDVSTLRDPQTDQQRTKPGHEPFLIVYGNCTHLGCVPLGNSPGDPKGDFDGWFCPCHGSHYDTSGRIRKGPAPKNLAVPDYDFLSDTKVKVG
jgi:ubiquinol-cytochrome c reductase iron-sulfur subunit